VIKRSVRPKYKDLYLQTLKELKSSEDMVEYWTKQYNALMRVYKTAVANQIKGICDDCEKPGVSCFLTDTKYCSLFSRKEEIKK
jgi:hypothetical protein